MGTEAKVEEKTQGTSAPQEGGSPPAQQPAKAEAKETPKAEAKSETSKSVTKEDKQTALFDDKKSPTTRQLIDDEDELPDNETFQLTKKAFNARMDRATKAQLRDVASDLGIDVVSLKEGSAIRDAIKARFAKLKDLEDKEEERRRKELSEIERHKEDAAREKMRADAAEQRWQAEQMERAHERYDTTFEKVARDLVGEEYQDYAVQRFARHLLNEVGEKKLAEMTTLSDKTVREWLKEFVEKHPKFAKDSGEEKPQVPVKTAPLDNGATPKKPDNQQASGHGTGKTARPGQPNSMTKAEITKEFGYRW